MCLSVCLCYFESLDLESSFLYAGTFSEYLVHVHKGHRVTVKVKVTGPK